MLEAAMIAHACIQRILPRMPERRVAQIMRERNRLGQILVQSQRARDRACDLRNFQTVREARAEMVAFVVDEDLGLVFEPAKRRGMYDAVAVALKVAASLGRRFRYPPTARTIGRYCVGCKLMHVRSTFRAHPPMRAAENRS